MGVIGARPLDGERNQGAEPVGAGKKKGSELSVTTRNLFQILFAHRVLHNYLLEHTGFFPPLRKCRQFCVRVRDDFDEVGLFGAGLEWNGLCGSVERWRDETFFG
jgi:hypothetical protein